MKTLFAFYALSMLFLSACGKETPSNNDEAPSPSVVTVVPTPTPTPRPTVSITYYSKTETRTPHSSWPTKTYTTTGHCLVYDTDIYCWDDGKKTLQWSSGGNNYGPYYYSFFNINRRANGTMSISNGGMNEDYMASPTYIAIGSGLDINMEVGVRTRVFSGTPTTVTCDIEDSGNLTCPGFSIDVNQEAV